MLEKAVIYGILLSLLCGVGQGASCYTACEVTSWGTWSACSGTCGGATRTRYAVSVCCQRGWAQSECQQNCYNNLIENVICNTACVNGVWNSGSLQCDCSAGYTGSCCNQVIVNCASSPCQNGGSCTDINGGTSYSCECSFLSSGTNCETLNTGVVAGIVIGCLLLIAVIVLVVILCCLKKEKKKPVITVKSKSKVHDQSMSNITAMVPPKTMDGRESSNQDSPWPYNTNTKTPLPEREEAGVVISVPPVSHCSFRNETEEFLLLSERTFVSFISKNE